METHPGQADLRRSARGDHKFNKIENNLTEEKQIIGLPAEGEVLMEKNRGSADRESADRERASVSKHTLGACGPGAKLPAARFRTGPCGTVFSSLC